MVSFNMADFGVPLLEVGIYRLIANVKIINIKNFKIKDSVYLIRICLSNALFTSGFLFKAFMRGKGFFFSTNILRQSTGISQGAGARIHDSAF